MRLDKYLADMSFGTRNEVKDIIKKQRVKVNGIICKDPSSHIKENDLVTVDDEEVSYVTYEYYLLNKPAGYLSATEDYKYPVVTELIDSKRKDLAPVGRLDLDTEGLLLISNDGQLAHKLLSPKYHVDKKYYVEVEVPLCKEAEELFSKPMDLGDFITEECKFERLDDNHAYLTIHEGKFHQVKRMFENVGSPVTYLKRETFSFLNLEGLEIGEYRELTKEEIDKLYNN